MYACLTGGQESSHLLMGVQPQQSLSQQEAGSAHLDRHRRQMMLLYNGCNRWRHHRKSCRMCIASAVR